MRKLFVVAVAAVASVVVLQASAGGGKTGEIKGSHICCGMCVKIVEGMLAKVDGLSDVKVDKGSKTVTFTAKDKKTAEKAVAAMYEGGFSGAAKYGDANITPAAAKLDGKAKEVTVKNVHACCGQCVKALKATFPGAEVKVDGKGPQKDVHISGTDLSLSEVMQKLHEAGFNGKIEK
jgi:copper chaperone CopZ